MLRPDFDQLATHEPLPVRRALPQKRFRQRFMYRLMQMMALEQPRRLGEMIQAIFTRSPEFFDPDAASNAGPHFVHPYTEFTDEMREELRMSDED